MKGVIIIIIKVSDLDKNNYSNNNYCYNYYDVDDDQYNNNYF